MAAFTRIGTVLLGATGVLAAVAALEAPAFGYGGEPNAPVIAVSASVVQAGGSLTVQTSRRWSSPWSRFRST